MLAKESVDESLSSVGAQGRAKPRFAEMETVTRELLDKARSFYLNFARQEPWNAAIAKEMAMAHSRLGDIYRLLEMHEDACMIQRSYLSVWEARADHPKSLNIAEPCLLP